MAERLLSTSRLATADGGFVVLDYSHAPQLTPYAMVYVHGFGSIRSGEKALALASASARRGWGFAAFDFRGHGESSGTLKDLRPTRLLEDLDVVTRHLQLQGVEKIGLVGNSMGGWASCWFALQRPELLPAITLIAPGFHFLTARHDRLTPEEREQWRREGVLRIRSPWLNAELGYGVVEEAPSFPQERLPRELTVPLLIFQGMKDDIVPYGRIVEFASRLERTTAQIRLYSDGDHRLTDHKEAMADAACDFFAKHLASSPR